MNFQDNKPIYQQIIELMEDYIMLDEWVEGGRVPSIREFGVTLGVNPNTCVRAYENLMREGVIEPRRGTGYWVLEGAKAEILAHRRREFLEQTIPDLIVRMSTLGIAPQTVVDMILTA